MRVHVEEHFTGSETVRDIVIGMADGLTVPFALAAGISGALATSDIVVTAGLAEIVAGSIAMGLGGYLAAKSDAEHYEKELRREEREIVEQPEDEEREIFEIFAQYGVQPEECRGVVEALRRRPEAWRDFMMQFELGLSKPEPNRAWRSALNIGGAYVVGGLVPLVPYMLIAQTAKALPLSVGITLAALTVFGWIKGHFTGLSRWKSALHTVLVGGLAAAAAFLIAGWIS